MEQSYTLRPEFLLLGFFFFLVSVHAQISIPSKQEGFWYKDRAAGIDSILIEAFLDPVCPDSRDSWPPLKQAVEHYGSRVSLVVYPFALPYHDNAFVCSRALHTVNKLNSSSTYKLLESFFGNQEEFYNKATSNLSRVSVAAYVAKFAANTVANSLYDEIKSGFTDDTTDLATRYSFKYGCLKGVCGTPFFFVNGFALPGAGSAIAYKDWRDFIDPLVKESRRVQPSHYSF